MKFFCSTSLVLVSLNIGCFQTLRHVFAAASSRGDGAGGDGDRMVVDDEAPLDAGSGSNDEPLPDGQEEIKEEDNDHRVQVEQMQRKEPALRFSTTWRGDLQDIIENFDNASYVSALPMKSLNHIDMEGLRQALDDALLSLAIENRKRALPQKSGPEKAFLGKTRRKADPDEHEVDKKLEEETKQKELEQEERKKLQRQLEEIRVEKHEKYQEWLEHHPNALQQGGEKKNDAPSTSGTCYDGSEEQLTSTSNGKRKAETRQAQSGSSDHQEDTWPHWTKLTPDGQRQKQKDVDPLDGSWDLLASEWLFFEKFSRSSSSYALELFNGEQVKKRPLEPDATRSLHHLGSNAASLSLVNALLNHEIYYPKLRALIKREFRNSRVPTFLVYGHPNIPGCAANGTNHEKGLLIELAALKGRRLATVEEFLSLLLHELVHNFYGHGEGARNEENLNFWMTFGEWKTEVMGATTDEDVSDALRSLESEFPNDDHDIREKYDPSADEWDTSKKSSTSNVHYPGDDRHGPGDYFAYSSSFGRGPPPPPAGGAVRIGGRRARGPGLA
ncbi:unnamed protein product [Amoebophrya sp. A25]|nr:unnamed protein product [Amoebophrya sp. A25]|eukprot:GSA25T00017657001.1